MTKGLGLWFIFAACAGAQTVSKISFDGIGDSSLRIHFNTSSTLNLSRVRYGTTDCSSGTGGMVQTNTSVAGWSGGFPLFDMTLNISGLAPSTTYFVCPEVSSNSGSTWSSGISATVTTLPRTTTLPAPPVAVPNEFPAQTGTVRNVAADCSNLQTQINAAVPGDTIVVPAGTICTGHYTTPTAPDAVTFTPSSVQTSTSQVTITAHPFTENEAVRVSTGAANFGCLPGMLIFGSPTNAQGFNCDIGFGWRKGGQYWVHVVDANHVQLLNAPSGSPVIPGFIVFTANTGGSTITFAPTYQTPGGFTYLAAAGIPANSVVQFHSTGTLPGGLSLNTNYFLLSACPASASAACTTQVSLTSGGTPVTITSAGTGTQRIVDQGLGTMYMSPAPPALGTGHDILITSSGSLPPAGVRTTPDFDAQAFHFRQMTTLSTQPLFQPGIMAHNWRISGAVFDTATNTDFLTTTDPRPYCGILTTNMDHSNILFDRVRVQGPGYPNRFGCSTAMFLNGANVGFVNSDLRGMDYWHPWAEVGGFCIITDPRCISNGSVTSTAVTISPGKFHGGAFTTATTGNTVITLTSGGSVTGTAYVYFAMDGTMKVLPPSGTSWTCVAPGTTCTVLAGVASPTWPLDGNGRLAAGILAVIQLTGGSIGGSTPFGGSGACADGPDQNGCLAPYSYVSVNATEGSQAIIAGQGPGPAIVDNNYISGVGNTLHFDDSGAFVPRGDYTVTRNTFNIPATQMAGGPSSNGLRYLHRNTLEWKGGQRILVAGNVFQGGWSEVSPACLTVAMTPRDGGTTTDVDVHDNTINGCGGLNIPAPVDQQPVSVPGQRTHIWNNLFLLNGWTHYVVGIGAPRGWWIEAGYGSEDAWVDHNTGYDGRGTTPELLFELSYPAGGMAITNNVYFYTGNGPMISNDVVPKPGGVCTGQNDKAGMDCFFTSGPGNPGYTFANNVIVPSWSDSQGLTGFVGAATVNAAFPSPLVDAIPSGSSLAANLSTIGFVAPASPITNGPDQTNPPLDVHLSSGSSYLRSATTGTQAGANIEQMHVTQGLIEQLRPLAVSSTSATISAFVPQAAQNCYVGFGTSNTAGTWTWTAADTTNSRQRNIAVSGLSSKTQYFYTLACDHTAFPSIQTFRTE